ncbi:ImmA/IrrE family metallo-endopeptidase [Knoellia sp. S7-12]|uniref:ImmA/IrrE family metallo-endopeptidase n=1 Tax=Knoellia sp. S7-12 TaxID=3126698 RepID=UPI003368A4F4
MTAIRRLSALEEAMRLRPGVAPDVLIETLAEQLTLDGEVEPPVDMRLLASLQSIIEITQTVSSHSGCLINDRGRLRIELCATDSAVRQNFTMGHEICHTLLPGFTMTTNFRCNPGASKPKAGAELKVEWLADVGASELLLPRRFVQDSFAGAQFGWDSIETVAAAYGASLAATARRYVRLSAMPSFFASLEFAASRSNPQPELRVTSASWSSGLEVFIPRNKSVPREHPIFQATQGEYVDEITDMRSLCLSGGYRVAARPYPYNNHEGESVMRVLALGLAATAAGRPGR